MPNTFVINSYLFNILNSIISIFGSKTLCRRLLPYYRYKVETSQPPIYTFKFPINRNSYIGLHSMQNRTFKWRITTMKITPQKTINIINNFIFIHIRFGQKYNTY